MLWPTPRGEVPERSNGAVSKTVDLATGPWVRIPPSPLAPRSGSQVPENLASSTRSKMSADGVQRSRSVRKRPGQPSHQHGFGKAYAFLLEWRRRARRPLPTQPHGLKIIPAGAGLAQRRTCFLRQGRKVTLHTALGEVPDSSRMIRWDDGQTPRLPTSRMGSDPLAGCGEVSARALASRASIDWNRGY